MAGLGTVGGDSEDGGDIRLRGDIALVLEDGCGEGAHRGEAGGAG